LDEYQLSLENTATKVTSLKWSFLPIKKGRLMLTFGSVNNLNFWLGGKQNYKLTIPRFKAVIAA